MELDIYFNLLLFLFLFKNKDYHSNRIISDNMILNDIPSGIYVTVQIKIQDNLKSS